MANQEGQAGPMGRAMACRPMWRGSWPLERVLFAMAGTVTLLSVLLVALVSPWFLILTAFVGLNQLLFVATGTCPASLVLGATLGLSTGLDGSSR
jgi:hypothetical protein